MSDKWGFVFLWFVVIPGLGLIAFCAGGISHALYATLNDPLVPVYPPDWIWPVVVAWHIWTGFYLAAFGAWLLWNKWSARRG